MNYLQRKRMALMRAANSVKQQTNTVTGYPITLTDSAGKDIISLSIQGNAKQDDTVALDNPCEVYGVGDKTVNLFDISKVPETSGIKKDGNTLTLLSYTCSTSITPSKFLAMTGLSSGDTIRISRAFKVIKGTINSVTGRIAFLGKNGVGDFVLISNEQAPVTKVIPENFNSDNYSGMYIYGAHRPDSSGEMLAEMSDIQITKGSESYEYEPYGYKIPIEVTSKNLFPTDEFKNIVLSNVSGATVKTVDGRECISANSGYMNNITGTGPEELKYLFTHGIKANTRYTLAFSIKNTAVSSLLWVCIYHTDGTWAYSKQTTVANGEWHTFIVTSAAGKTVSGIGFTYGNGGIRVYDYSTAMLVEGVYTADTMPPYQPYFTDVTNILPINIPLYGVDGYNDELSLDFSRKKATLTRRVQKMVIDGNTTLRDYYPLAVIDLAKPNWIVPETKGMCSHIPYDLGYVSRGNASGTTLAISHLDTYFGCSTIDDFKAWLTQNPLTVYYALQTPVVEDVSDKIQWDNIPTPTDTVNIQALTDVQPQGMTVKYFAG